MKILYLISSEGYFGAENMLIALARGVRDAAADCVIGVFADTRVPHLEIAEAAERRGIKVEIIPCRGRFDWNTVRRLRALAIRHGVDIIHCHGYKADIYARLAVRFGPVALVATCHNWPSKLWKMRAYSLLDRMVLRSFDCVVAVSPNVRRMLCAWVAHKRLAMIPNGVDPSLFTATAGTIRQEFGLTGPIVGFVGRLVPDKGGPFLLKVAKSVVAHRPDARFLFVGDGPARDEWKCLATELQLSHKVIFAGVRSDMAHVYQAIDILALPSRCEAMPMCVLESMAAGKPVVATPVGSLPELITHNRTGILAPYGDANAWSAALIRLIDDPAIRTQLSVNALTRIVQSYSAEAMARKYLNVYNAAMTAHGTEKANRLSHTFHHV